MEGFLFYCHFFCVLPFDVHCIQLVYLGVLMLGIDNILVLFPYQKKKKEVLGTKFELTIEIWKTVLWSYSPLKHCVCKNTRPILHVFSCSLEHPTKNMWKYVKFVLKNHHVLRTNSKKTIFSKKISKHVF